MTIEARASRNATRRNNAIKKRYPLLNVAGVIPDNWLTTEEAERERLSRWDRQWEISEKRLARFNRRMARKAAQFRQMVARGCTMSELDQLDRRAKVFPEQPVYAAEFWRAVLTGACWLEL